MNLKLKFGKAVHNAREKLDYTQSEVAEAVSVSVRWYQKIEAGQRLPGFLSGLRLIIFLHINLEDFWEEVGLRVPVSSVQGKSRRRSA